MKNEGEYIKWFSELKGDELSLAGGKGVNLAVMYNSKFPVPAGFVITSEAYRDFIEKNGLKEHIENILRSADIGNISSLESHSAKVRKLIEHGELPPELESSILDAYEVLDVDKKKYSGASEGALSILQTGHEPPFVAVRNSPVATNFETASFAGRHDSFLNVKGNDELIKHVKKVFASLYTSKAINYRQKHGIRKAEIGVVVQNMIDSQKSGVMYSSNPIRSDETILIEGVFGLGTGIVQGKISPDSYLVNNNFELIEQKISDKKVALTRDSAGNTDAVQLNDEISRREVLTGHEIKILSQYAKKLEESFGAPQDIEFAVGGGEISILQSRPISAFSNKFESELSGNVIFTGKPASDGVISGIVKVIRNEGDIEKFQRGNIAVVNDSSILGSLNHKASGIVSNVGGVSSHEIVVAREFGVPAVIDTKTATEKLKDGEIITVDGFTGRVIEGRGIEKKFEIKEAVKTGRTKLKLEIDIPGYAKRGLSSGLSDVGMVRMDSVILPSGKHPVWYSVNNKLNELSEELIIGIKMISENYDEIRFKTSDFKGDEFRNLEGAPIKKEQNPMMGDRGIRFSLKNQELLETELKAIKEIADKYSEKKFGVMTSNLISVKELKRFKEICREVELPDNVSIGISVDTPASVQIINELCEMGIDFVNIGLNELTQHTLAVDKNNEEIKQLYNSMNPAILNSIGYVIRRCNRYKIESFLNWERDTDLQMAKFLVDNKIGGIVVTPDLAKDVSEAVSDAENYKSDKMEAKELVKDDANDEKIILEALGDESEDEYSPSLQEKQSDIPKLNEAIPVDSSDLGESDGKNEEIRMGKENEGLDDFKSFFEDDEKNGDDKDDVIDEFFEEQEDKELAKDVEEEVKESEVREQAKKQILGQAQKGITGEQEGEEQGEDQAMDIF